MPSGVVFVAILVIWAVILAPRAMKLYERTATQRTTKRFSSAMTVLGNGKTVARVAVDTARRGARVTVDTHAPEFSSPGLGQSPDHGSGARRQGTSRAVFRRRQLTAAFGVFLLLATLAGLLAVIPWPAVALSGVPLVLFLGACAASAGHRRKAAAVRAQNRVEAHDQALAAARQPDVADSAARSEPTGVVMLSSRRARRSGLRPGSWTHARVIEADLAIAATYASPEEQLGLDRYVASPSAVDGQPYLRAANE